MSDDHTKLTEGEEETMASELKRNIEAPATRSPVPGGLTSVPSPFVAGRNTPTQ